MSFSFPWFRAAPCGLSRDRDKAALVRGAAHRASENRKASAGGKPVWQLERNGGGFTNPERKAGGGQRRWRKGERDASTRRIGYARSQHAPSARPRIVAR